MMTTDAAGVLSSNTRRKKSFYAEEEDIVVKPSTELIPDEYEHLSNDTVLLHIFRTPLEQELADDVVQSLQGIDYSIDPERNLHYLSKVKPFLRDLETIKQESLDKSALVLIFIGFYEHGHDGSLLMMDENGSSENSVNIKDIWNLFSSNNCLELKNKPKIFLYCTSRRPVIRVESDSLRHRTMVFDKVYDFPAEADMLIVFMKSDDPHQRVKRAFLRQFCANIENYSKKYDIIDLVSHMEKYVPLVISTLTRKFYLTPNNEREHYLSIVENHDSLGNSLEKIKDAVQKLHDIQKKKKEKKFSFSFKRKSEEKPKIIQKESTITEKPRISKTLEVTSRRVSISSAAGTGGRSRHLSETERDGKVNTAALKKKPLWKP